MDAGEEGLVAEAVVVVASSVLLCGQCGLKLYIP